MPLADLVPFFSAWLSAPLRTAAVVPSSSTLAAAMTIEFSSATGPVIELGPGTGVFTQGLLAQGVAEHQLTLIEANDSFVTLLRQRFPSARILHLDAARLKDLPTTRETRAGAIVSGLPLLSMPPRKVFAIMAGAFRQLCSDGYFYQFTYAGRCPVARPILDRLGLKARRIGGTWANLPPASVYRIGRRAQRFHGWALVDGNEKKASE